MPPGIDASISRVDVANGHETHSTYFDGLGFVAALSDVNDGLVERYAYDRNRANQR